MPFPTAPVVLPSDLISAPNGRLPEANLTTVTFVGRGNAQLHRQAARAWKALVAAVLTATGVQLTITSLADAYRSYARQLSGFLTRYEPCSLAVYLITPKDRRRKFAYNGSTYWRLRRNADGTYPAAMAVPATSNHGWGLALDVAVYIDGQVKALYGSKAWSYVLANAGRYGFTWESQKEPWHIRYILGDETPQAVLDYEGPLTLPPFHPERGEFGLYPFVKDMGFFDVLRLGSTGDHVRYLQGVLNLKAGNCPVTGQMDAHTVSRVKDLQRLFRLTVDGIVGPQTWGAVQYLANG